MQSKMAGRSNTKFTHEGALKFELSVVFLSWSVATLVDVLAVWCWCRLRDFSSSSEIKTTTYITPPYIFNLSCIFSRRFGLKTRVCFMRATLC